MEEKYYDTEELIKRFGVTKKYLYGCIKNGLLTGIKFGTKWRFTDDDIKKFTDSLRNKREDD